MNKARFNRRPCLLITLGDPAGIGPEVVARSLSSLKPKDRVIVFGDIEVLKKACRFAGFSERRLIFGEEKERCICIMGSQMEQPFLPARSAGRLDASCGSYAAKWIAEAAGYSQTLLRHKIPNALVTAPINKESAMLGGFRFSGHTDYLAHLYGAKSASMMFFSSRLRVILVTIHCSLLKAVRSITKDLVLEKICHAAKALKSFGVKNPRILVSGLNPHAGEGGAFGSEEDRLITPAIRAAGKKGIRASGPYPPDTVFLKAASDPSSCVVAMYHDQGLIAFKLLSFSDGVNVTVGLPVLRTSPDHGTAFDISWKGKADKRSFMEALSLAKKSLKIKAGSKLYRDLHF